jgi:hypothetical protein
MSKAHKALFPIVSFWLQLRPLEPPYLPLGPPKILVVEDAELLAVGSAQVSGLVPSKAGIHDPLRVIYGRAATLFGSNRGADSSARDTYGLGDRGHLRAASI